MYLCLTKGCERSAAYRSAEKDKHTRTQARSSSKCFRIFTRSYIVSPADVLDSSVESWLGNVCKKSTANIVDICVLRCHWFATFQGHVGTAVHV